jgi:hypothetical protein
LIDEICPGTATGSRDPCCQYDQVHGVAIAERHITDGEVVNDTAQGSVNGIEAWRFARNHYSGGEITGGESYVDTCRLLDL